MLEERCAVIKDSMDTRPVRSATKAGSETPCGVWLNYTVRVNPTPNRHLAGPILNWGPRKSCEEPLQILYRIPGVPKSRGTVTKVIYSDLDYQNNLDLKTDT